LVCAVAPHPSKPPTRRITDVAELALHADPSKPPTRRITPQLAAELVPCF